MDRQQTDYIDKMAGKFLQGDHTKLWNVPVNPDEEGIAKFMALEPSKDDAEATKILDKGFMSIVGSLLYAFAGGGVYLPPFLMIASGG